jgi:hypothetical protein
MAYLYPVPSCRCGPGDFPSFRTAILPAPCDNRAVGGVGFYLTPVILLVLR